MGLGMGGGGGGGGLGMGMGGRALALGAGGGGVSAAGFRAGVAPLRARLGGRVFKIGGYGFNPSFLSSTTAVGGDVGVSPVPSIDPSLPSLDTVQVTRLKEKEELQVLNDKFATFIDKVCNENITLFIQAVSLMSIINNNLCWYLATMLHSF